MEPCAEVRVVTSIPGSDCGPREGPSPAHTQGSPGSPASERLTGRSCSDIFSGSPASHLPNPRPSLVPREPYLAKALLPGRLCPRKSILSLERTVQGNSPSDG